MKNVQQVLVALALVLALAGLIGAIISGFGTRLGLWEFGSGFSVLKWSVYAAIAGVVLALAGAVLAVPAGARLLDTRLLAAAIVGLAVFGITYSFAHQFKKTPTVADASTNIEDPPVFVALIPVRVETAKNPLAYRRDEAADLQQRYFPDLTEVVEFDQPPAEVIRLAATVAEEMGFEIIDVAPREGRLEATDTTFWYGFKDDIVVRARPQADGKTRVDVRSASRVGYLDGGLNARRIQEFLQKLAAEMN
ncbi:MAG TPA: DUF1499 domain-containing protein [Gammaproteobacteria bacterium]